MDFFYFTFVKVILIHTDDEDKQQLGVKEQEDLPSHLNYWRRKFLIQKYASPLKERLFIMPVMLEAYQKALTENRKSNTSLAKKNKLRDQIAVGDK